MIALFTFIIVMLIAILLKILSDRRIKRKLRKFESNPYMYKKESATTNQEMGDDNGTGNVENKR